MPSHRTDADAVRESFGKRVRQLRLGVGLSQEQLAFRAGIHATYLSSVERGQRNVSLINIHAIARGLAVSPRLLFPE